MPNPEDTKKGAGSSFLQSEDRESCRESEQALYECGSRLQGIIDSSPIPQFVIDREHRILYWNQALEHYSGVRAEDVVGTNLHWKAFYPGERPCMADLLVDGIIEKIPQWYEGKYRKSPLVEGAYDATDFFPHLGKTGVWLHFTAAVIKDEDGNVTGAVETLEDITEQKNAESAVIDREIKLREIIAGSPIPQFVINRHHRILCWNHALEHYSGIRAEDVIGTTQHWKAFYPSERPCMADLLVDGLMEKIPQWYEGKYKKSKLIDGAYEAPDFFPHLGAKGTWLYFTAALIRDAGGNILGAVETLEDITEQKNAEEQILEQLNEKTILLREIHHRVKNNLQIIISLLHLQSQYYVKDDTIRSLIRASENRVRAMSSVHEKLFLSKDLSNIDFADYIHNMAMHLYSLYDIDSEKIRLVIDAGNVMLDINTAIPIGLILNELISNALRHAFPLNGSGEIMVTARDNTRSLQITVHDNGEGFPENIDLETTQRFGLRIAGILADQVGGTISYLNDEGATATLIIPKPAGNKVSGGAGK